MNTRVEHLLDMSRLRRAPPRSSADQDCHTVVEPPSSTGSGARDRVGFDVPADVPPISTDPALLERAVTDLVDNALVHGGGTPVRIEVGSVAGQVYIRVVDRGPGIPRGDRERVFRPIQHFGGPDQQVGVGSDSAWPVGSSRRSAGSSTSRTRPVAGAPW